MPELSAHFPDRMLAARPDLAAADLRGRVEAARFTEGAPHSVSAPLLDLTLVPDAGAERATQLLHGERFTVFETRDDGLAWGRAGRDGYVGYVAAAGLGPARSDTRPDTRFVTALWSQIYPRPEIRARAEADLPLGAAVSVAGTTGAFARLRGGGFVPRAHLAEVQGDAVAQAERFLGVPYLWGGRSARGIDCSALVQLALMLTGRDCPRDSDIQQASLGVALRPDAALQRGDLVFWKRHVGWLTDPWTLLHANGHHMAVAVEPLAQAVARIEAAGGGPVTGCRRPGAA